MIIAEDLNYLWLEVVLLGMGVEVIHTKDGKGTINTVKDQPEINLILMDIKKCYANKNVCGHGYRR